MIRNPKHRHARSISLFACSLLAAGLGGCAMPNSSNPTLEVSRASVLNGRANLDMVVRNESDMDVEIGAVEWSLVYGPLPVADGTWTLATLVPSKGEYRFSKQVPFTTPPLDPSAGSVELSGKMNMQTKGDSGEMALKSAGFVAQKAVTR